MSCLTVFILKPGLLTKSVLISVWHLLQNVLVASVLCGQSTDDHVLNEAMLFVQQKQSSCHHANIFSSNHLCRFRRAVQNRRR